MFTSCEDFQKQEKQEQQEQQEREQRELLREHSIQSAHSTAAVKLSRDQPKQQKISKNTKSTRLSSGPSNQRGMSHHKNQSSHLTPNYISHLAVDCIQGASNHANRRNPNLCSNV